MMKVNSLLKKMYPVLSNLILISGLPFILLDSYFFYGFTRHYFKIPLLLILALLLSLSIILKIFLVWKSKAEKLSVAPASRKLNQMIIKLLLSFFTAGSAFYYFMIFSEYNFFRNYTLSKFHIHYQSFSFFIIYLLLSLLLIRIERFFHKKSKNKLNKYLNNLLLLNLPLIFFTYTQTIRLIDYDFYVSLKVEDSLYEYLQFFLYLVSSVTSFLIAKKVKHKKILMILYFTASFGFFFLAGEEISWGQRIFNIKTPEKWAETNLQDETNIHNDARLLGLIYRVCFLISAYGSFSFLVKYFAQTKIGKKIFKIKDLDIYLEHFTVSPKYLSFFLLPFVYYYVRIYLQLLGWELEEIIETLLIPGITFKLLDNYLTVNDHQEKK